MQSRIVLVSDDSDFFEFISPKLMLRKYDEMYRFCFDDVPDKLHLLHNSVIIVNSEETQEKTLDLLRMVKDVPIIVFCFNDDEKFKIEAYKNGMFEYITLFTADDEISAKLVSALNVTSALSKSNMYREMLVKKNLISQSNEVFIDYIGILDNEIRKIKDSGMKAVLAAISPNEKTKFLIQPNLIETVILNNVRKNDILMSYATNKYFLLLFDTDLDGAEKIWSKIVEFIPEKIYAGFAKVGNKSREYVVNESLNRLHEAINRDVNYESAEKNIETGNFKIFRQEFNKKLERIITPVFYQIQQKYNDKLYGMTIEQSVGDGFGCLSIKSRYANGEFKITSPGLSKINIDITYSPNPVTDEKKKFPTAKRIVLEPDEIEVGLLEDILEQFILEFKKEAGGNDYT